MFGLSTIRRLNLAGLRSAPSAAPEKMLTAAEKRAAAVKVGQTYRDNDPRANGRTLRVQAIEDGKAVCQVGVTPRRTRAKLDRFGTTSQTGYTLIRDENGNSVTL